MKTITHSTTPSISMELQIETYNPLGDTTVDTKIDYDGNDVPNPLVNVLVRSVAADGRPLAELMFQEYELKDGNVYSLFYSGESTLTVEEKLAWLTYAGLDTDEESIMNFRPDSSPDDCAYEAALNAYFDSELAWDLTCGPVGKAYRAEYDRLVEWWHIEQEVDGELANV